MKTLFLRFASLVALGTFAFSECAQAADECGAIGAGPGFVVACDNAALNPYAGGITYAPPAGIDFNLAPGVVVDRTPGANNHAIRITSNSTSAFFVTLDAGSEVHASGEDAIGVLVQGMGDISIVAGGLITTFDGTPLAYDYVGPYGIFGNIAGGGTGELSIRLLDTGVVETDGEAGVGVYAAHNGAGNVSVTIDGRIQTSGYSSDGAVSWINNAVSTGSAFLHLSDTADIVTLGLESQGAWALNAGLGSAIIESAGRVRTTKDNSNGLVAWIYGGGNIAEARVDLLEGGSVTTEGANSHAISLSHSGTGDAIARLESGTSLVTSGDRSHGVSSSTSGATFVSQSAWSTITATGLESYGLRLSGARSVAAEIGGSVTASGNFGVGVSALSSTDTTEVTVGRDAVISGGWQTNVAGVGGSFGRPAAGIIIGSALSSTIENAGTIGALSDRAIVDNGRYSVLDGNLSITNAGAILGFIELDSGGTNSFANLSGGIFDVRHFADADGDGIRDTKRVAISDFGAPTSSFDNAAGATVRLAPVPGSVTTDATGYYTPTTGFDDRPLDASYYALARSGIVQGQLVNLGSFTNSGVIDLRGSAIGNTLLMTSNATAGGVPGSGAFISDGGQLILNTVMNSGLALGGASGSFSDVLIVDRTQMGSAATTIVIDRREGGGAATPGNGILVVEVRDAAQSAAGVFSLNGDHTVNGQAAIIGGARSYALFQNGVGADAADGNWYLRTVGISPTIAVYENYPETIRPHLTLPTLLQRVGNREWSNAQTGVAKPACDDAEDYGRCRMGADRFVEDDPDLRSVTRADGSGLWSRFEGWHGVFELSPEGGTGRADSNARKMQMGYDLPIGAWDNGTLVGGLTAQYGTVDATISGTAGAGKIGSTGYGVGGTLTWYDNSGFYGDVQSQLSWIDSDLFSSTAKRSLVEGNDAFGYAASIEVGKRFAVAPGWNLVPQSQLIYSALDFDSFTDPFGAAVSLDDGNSLRLRAGVNSEFRKVWIACSQGPAERFSAHGGLNIHAELLDGMGVDVAGLAFSSQREDVWASLDIGGSYGSETLTVYGEASLSSGLGDLMESYVIGVQGGVRARW
jgi:fibronectin-binding autotransporter adhesin